MKRTIRILSLGLAALGAVVASAATIPSPYRPASSPAAAGRLAAEGQEGLDVDVAAVSALRNGSDAVVEIENFPVAPGASGKLRLSRFEVAASDARITVRGPDGETSRPMPKISHFSGTIEGEPDSSVYLAVTSDALVAYVHSSHGHAYVGPDESHTSFVVRNGDSPLNAAASGTTWTCASEELPAPLTAMAQPSFAAPRSPNVAGFKEAKVRIETDFQLYQHFGNDVDALTTYVMTLFGAVNVIYERDVQMHLTVTEVHTWSVADPYTGGDTMTQLEQLGAWWHTNRPMASYPRTYVHYLSGHPVSGGVAWIGVLCSGDFDLGGGNWGGGYGLTQVFGTYPLSLWDQDASAHEMGHNAGSPHTHCMGPPTYPDWTDKCYGSEGTGCYSGTPQNPGIGNGTIMSYCHLLGWQYMSFVFHPRCINDKMLPEINSASCLVAEATFVDVPTSDPFFHYVETVYQKGVTGGCNTQPLMYCPTNSVTRQQMAVFLLKAMHGSAYTPPSCAGAFGDVACPSQYANWIEELANEGVTSGCGNGNYCPLDSVTRQQMAVFLLKAEHGSSYTPPACSSAPFPDVPCPSTYANWIKQLVAESITGGCSGGNYCPLDPVTRAQMAVFLTKTFNLAW
jgi:Metallo-peptidase family M12/S-layer homology domain